MNEDLEHELERGPEAIAKALTAWRTATYERKKKEALLYAQYKGKAAIEGEKVSATELKHMVQADSSLSEAVLTEIKAEAEYQRIYEKHLANKRRAGLRTAF